MLKKFIIISITLGIILSPYSFDFPETNNLYAQTEIPCSKTIYESITWFASSSPYVISGDYQLRILPGVVLTIEPGVTVKFSENGGLAVNGGEIIAKGTKENPIIFTSNHGSSYPQSGGWSSIEVYNHGKITFDYAVVEYGGFIQYYDHLDNKIFKPNTALAQDYYYDDFTGAITMYGAEANINNSVITNNTIGLKVMDCDFYNTTSIVTIHNSQVYDNDRYGIKNEGSSQVDATYNWWGDDSGPAHPDNPGGLGDMVSDNVLYNPWTGQEEEGEIDPLILQYEPILYFHPNETYQPMNVEAYVNHCSLWDSHGAADDELLISESELAPLTLEDLNFPNMDSYSYYLQFSEGLVEEILGKKPNFDKAKTEYLEEMKKGGKVEYTYYARKMIDTVEETGEEYIILQYWFFYAMSDFGAHIEGGNVHEGDWEVIMVFIDKETEEPKYVAHSVHINRGEKGFPGFQYESVRNNWNSEELNKEEDHIFSLVGLGSHANYPNNGDSGHHPLPANFPDDLTSYDGLQLNNENWKPFVFEENNFPNWLVNYEGYWGVFNDYPGSCGTNPPYYTLYNKFNEPIEWAGIDKIGKLKVITENLYAFEFAKQNTKIAFNKVVDKGTVFLVDLHDEIVQIGENLKNIAFLPHFWDIESSLKNDTFEAEVSFEYDTEETEAMGIEEEYLAVFLYNEDNKIWEKIPSVTDISNKVISFFTTHFSRYALGAELWQDISEEVKVNKDWKRYDHKTGIKHINARVKNKTKANIFGDIRLIIKDINKEDVFLVNNTATTSEGYPYIEIKANDLYNHCIFTGDEEDIPEDLNKKGWLKKIIKKKMIRKKPLNRKTCEKIINKYPELEEKLEYTLLPHHHTKPIKLEFSLPIKKTKTIKYHGKEITI